MSNKVLDFAKLEVLGGDLRRSGIVEGKKLYVDASYI